MKKKFIILSILLCLILPLISQSAGGSQNDALYSQEYFDYIIEQAAQLKQEEKENQAKEIKPIEIAQDEYASDPDNITILDDYTPFKLRIHEEILQPKYKETYKKESTRVLVPIGKRFSFVQNLSKSRNKYNSTDYKILAGTEYNFGKYFNLEAGLETNYRGYDQNPQSRKFYITPTIMFGDKVSLSLIQKYNPYTGSSDHDLNFRISPLKSKAFDFGIYSSITCYTTGRTDESISFSTNFYFK